MLRATPCSAGAAAGRGLPRAAARQTTAQGKGVAFFRVAESSTSSSPLLPRPARPSSLAARAAAAASSPPAPLSTSPASPSSSAASFDWTSHWYPVGSTLSTLDPTRPNKVRLLGRDLVVWLDGSESSSSSSPSPSPSPSWRAAVDECPHRLAAMSDGRLENGTLSCRYHGWEFGGEKGKCLRCPQAIDHKAEATVLSSPRSRLRSFPCKVAQGLVFVWPQEEKDGGFENAEKTPLPLVDDLDPEKSPVENGGIGGDWGFQRPPVDWLLMAENSMDPNHAPFLHETTMGPNTRQSAAPMEMRVSAEKPVTLSGFEVEHGGYTKSQQQNGMRATRSFQPPCSVFTRYTFESGPSKEKEACALIYFVPSEPGVSMIFARFFTRRRKAEAEGGETEAEKNKAPLTDAWRESTSSTTTTTTNNNDNNNNNNNNKRPKKPPLLSRLQSSLISKLLDSSLAHVLGQSLADQDVLVMHGIYKRMMAQSASSSKGASSSSSSSSSGAAAAAAGPDSETSSSSSSSRWKSSYWLATQADSGVRAFHDWVEKHGGGGPWGADLGASSFAASSLKPLPKEELLNHWERHTKHCSVCLSALARLERARAVVAVAAGAAAAAATAAGVVAVAVLLFVVPSSSAVSSTSAPQLTVAALAQVGLPCAAAAVFLALFWTSLTAWRERFYRADKLADEK